MAAALLPQASITAKADEPDVFDYSIAPSSDEVFYLRVKIASDGAAFQIPICGLIAYSSYASYSWSINWGDGSSSTRSGTASSSGCIPHTYSSIGTYTITITPNGTVSDGWFRAFGSGGHSFSGSNADTNKGQLTGFAGIFDDTSMNISTSNNYVCYNMFNYCPYLTAVNILLSTSATTIGDSFAEAMFAGCTSLTALPSRFSLPSGIKTVGTYFAEAMFAGCTTLESLPSGFSLPSDITTIGNCFAVGMFHNCTALTELPNGFNLPSSKTSSVGTYFAYSMFYGCNSLKELPSGFNLPSGIETAGKYFANNMFYNCTSLTALPCGFSLPSDITTVGDYFANNMFYNCTSLTALPSGFNLPSGIETSGTYFANYMFYNCTSLTALPSGFSLPSGIKTVGDYFANSMFSLCTSLESLPSGFSLPSKITTAGDYFAFSMFYRCTSLESLPSGFSLPSDITTVGDSFARDMFYDCTALNALPSGFNLPSGITTVGVAFADSMFYDCTALKALPSGFNLPSDITTVGNSFAYSMFYDCTSLESLPSGFNLPSSITTVGGYFAAYMFCNCTSLESLPSGFSLPRDITTVSTAFASYMFYACTNLKINSEFRVPVLTQTQMNSNNLLQYTFNGIEVEQYADEAASILSNLPTSDEAAYTKIYPHSDSDTFSEAFNNAESWNSIHANWKVTASTHNETPTASSVSVSGPARTGQTLTGTYTYSDPDSDTESGSTYQWYLAEDESCTSATPISGATSTTYTVAASCVTYYIAFEVTPSDGTGTGTAVMSSWVGPVTAASSETPTYIDDTYAHKSLIINGEKYSALNIKMSTDNGRTTTQVTIDSDRLENALDSTGENPTITIPVMTDCDTVSVAISGDSINAMSGSTAVLEIQTEYGTYKLPASEIDINSIAEQLGVDASDIETTITMGAPSDATVSVIENAAEEVGFSIMVPAVEFTVFCSHGSQTIEIDSFSAYVERTIAVPDGVDPQKITTAIVVGPDGTVRHVPTDITLIDGVYYAVINSLTNSAYTLIYNPVSFPDADGHWAKAAITDMASREIISGYPDNTFKPDGSITRAEFSAIIVRALGLPEGTGVSPFHDVSATYWCCGYIETAVSFGLMSGYPDGNFCPDEQFTREQAMTVVARAMDITKLDAGFSDGGIGSLLSRYSDVSSVSAYAVNGAAACLKTGIITSKPDGTLAPQDNITRAETAVVVQRLLVKSGLINSPESDSENIIEQLISEQQ